LPVAARQICRGIILYTALLGICYVLFRVIRPMSLGQLRSLHRTLLAANATAAFLLLIELLWGIVDLVNSHHRWAFTDSIMLLASYVFPLVWSAVLAGLLWAVPQKLHRWALLSILTIGASQCVRLGTLLFLQKLPADFLHTRLVWGLVIYTAIPISFALLGFVPAGRLDRRVAG
jgi:hypothetical protein